jgi:hypothetical protein
MCQHGGAAGGGDGGGEGGGQGGGEGGGGLGGGEGGGGPARAGASSKARRSHQHIRRRHFGGAEASTMSALAAAAAAAALPVSEVKSSLTSSVLGAETGRPLRSASASRSVSGVPNASTACRAPQGGCACAREGTRTSSRRDATQRACITQRLRACLPRPEGGGCSTRSAACGKFFAFNSSFSLVRRMPPSIKGGSRKPQR